MRALWARIAVIAIAVTASGGANASAGDVFTIAGGSLSASPRAGALATDVRFGQIEQIAAAPDGGVVVVDWRCCTQGEDRVWKVEPDGQLRQLAVGGFSRDGPRGDGVPAAKAWLGDVTDVAVAADGTVFLAAGCRIRRIGPDGLIWTLAGQNDDHACESSGDGGRASAARVNAGRLALSPRGILVADGCQVREIGPDGIIRALAGRTECRIEDGSAGPFRRFDEAIIGLAALPDGGAVVLDGEAVWRIHPDRRVSRLMSRGRISFDALETLPDGGVLVGGLGGRLLRVSLEGRVQPTTLPGSRLLSAFDGDAAPLRWPFVTTDLAVAADGGWLAAQGDRVRYVAPAKPARLALGIAPGTIRPRRPLRVSLVATTAARVTLDAHVRGRRTGTVTVDVPAGRSTVELPGAGVDALTVVTAMATAQGNITRDRFGVLASGTLPLPVAQAVMARWHATTRLIGGGRHRTRCRRYGSRRIDCASYDELCQYVVSFKLRRDGILTARDHRRERDFRCGFRARPGWRGARYGVELPVS